MDVLRRDPAFGYAGPSTSPTNRAGSDAKSACPEVGRDKLLLLVAAT